MVWWGSKCTGATCERRRNVPPRLPLWAMAGRGLPLPTAAPRARAVPPTFRRSRRVSEVARWSIGISFLPELAVEPGGHEPPAVVISEVRSVVDERPVPHRDVHAGPELHVVLLLGDVALGLVDDLPPLGRIHGAPLPDQHVGQHRVVDVAVVLDLPRVVLAVEEVVRLQERGLGPEGHGLVLAVERAGDVGPVLLGVQL